MKDATRPPALVLDEPLRGYLGELLALEAAVFAVERLAKGAVCRELGQLERLAASRWEQPAPPAVAAAATAWLADAPSLGSMPALPSTGFGDPAAKRLLEKYEPITLARAARISIVGVIADAAASTPAGQDAIAALLADATLDEQLDRILARALAVRGATVTPAVRALFERWLAVPAPAPGRPMQRASSAKDWAARLVVSSTA